MKGWVYVITNKAMPGLVKIGFSMKDTEIRASELKFSESINDFNKQLSLKVADLNKQQLNPTAQAKASIVEIRDKSPMPIRCVAMLFHG